MQRSRGHDEGTGDRQVSGGVVGGGHVPQCGDTVRSRCRAGSSACHAAGVTPDTRTTAPAGPGPVVRAAVVLTCVASAVGALVPWASPERSTSFWQVVDVPPSTAGLVLGAAAVCLVLAGLLVRPSSLPGRAAPVTWWLMTLASAFALAWNAVYAAALSTVVSGAVIPVFHWLFTFVPALVVGLATRAAGPREQLRAILGTAVVSLPLFALGCALLVPSGGLTAILGALYSTALLGVVPLGIAVAATWRRR